LRGRLDVSSGSRASHNECGLEAALKERLLDHDDKQHVATCIAQKTGMSAHLAL